MDDSPVLQLIGKGIDFLRHEDPSLYSLLLKEQLRQDSVLDMIASASRADPSVLACQAMAIGNVTTEGYPGARYHAGCEFVDQIERLAIARAKEAFGADYANVQPHSGTTANEIVMFSLLSPGDTILGLEVHSGGHLSHGASANVSGRYFRSIGYGLTDAGLIDYAQVAALAKQHRPRLIIAGASAYPRVIDFAAFRRIADDVGAYLLADISHIAGLVAANVHPSPINEAHFTTTSTYKQLFGPRGGLILMGRDHETKASNGKTLSELIQHAVFPFFQGTPALSAIAAKARALATVTKPEFKLLAQQIVANAKCLASVFSDLGYKILTDGTDNHIVLIDLTTRGITGLAAERALEKCNIIVNRNLVSGDKRSVLVTSGIRLGSNGLSARGMTPEAVGLAANLIHRVLGAIDLLDKNNPHLDVVVGDEVRAAVRQLCREFPTPRYPAAYSSSE